MDELKGFAPIVILTQTSSPRALKVNDLANKVSKIAGFAQRVEVSENSENAIKIALKIALDLGNSAGIIVLGSVVLAGEIGSIIKGGNKS